MQSITIAGGNGQIVIVPDRGAGLASFDVLTVDGAQPCRFTPGNSTGDQHE